MIPELVKPYHDLRQRAFAEMRKQSAEPGTLQCEKANATYLLTTAIGALIDGTSTPEHAGALVSQALVSIERAKDLSKPTE